MIREIMDVNEVSRYLGCGVTKVYQMIGRKAIPASRVGRQYRFLKRAVDLWLMRNIIMQDREFFKLLASAQQDFVRAGYTEEEIENAVQKVRKKKQGRS